MLGEMGPFTGSIVVQNLENQGITLYYYASIPGAITYARTAEAYGSTTLNVVDLGVPYPGSAVVVRGEKSDGTGAAHISGVHKQTAENPPDLIVQLLARASEYHQTVDGYSGFTELDWGKQVVLPIVQTNNGWNTAIRVKLSLADGTLQDTVTLTLRESGGGIPVDYSLTLTETEVGTFDLLDLGVPTGFIGTATISTPNYSVLAIAERYKVSTDMLIINRATRTEACAPTAYAPLVFDDYNYWNTGISVANLGAAPNDVAVTYFNLDGSEADSVNLTIPAYGMDFIYTPASGTGSGFLGAAVISGSEPLCAVVDEVKYLGDDPDQGHAMSYHTTADGAEAGQAMTLPLAQRGSSVTGLGDTTGIQLFNSDDQYDVVIEAYVHSESGVQEVYQQIQLPAMSGATIYFMNLTLPEEFRGSATIDVISAMGQVHAISNNVNYAVQYDGSASYTLIRKN